jgi:hypothetical protein
VAVVSSVMFTRQSQIDGPLGFSVEWEHRFEPHFPVFGDKADNTYIGGQSWRA